MFHNLIFHIVFSRRGGKDNVLSRDRFVLYNIFLRTKINLPSLILNNWMECIKQRSFNKVTSAYSNPYAMLFSVILRLYDSEASLNLNRLALYAVREEITRGTFNKMMIGEQFFPCVKAEPLGDIVGDSYKVGSLADPNVNLDSPFANFQEKRAA